MKSQSIKNKIKIFAPRSYRSVQIPKVEKMPVEDFMALPPVFCQRTVKFRAPKTKKLLKKKFYLSHLDVAIFEYPNGSRVKGNGNTRDVCWEEFIEEGMCELVPEFVNATIYPVANDEEAKALYYTFDSDDSVEKAPDKISGVFFAKNLIFNNTKLAKGNVGKSLYFASTGRPSNNNPKTTDWFKIVEDFAEELKAFDGIDPRKIWDSNLICAALMMLKRHGTKNARLLEALRQINDGVKGAQHPQHGTDGATFILEEWTTYKIFEQRGTDGISFPKQQDFLIYSLEKWMALEKIRHYRRPSGRSAAGKGCRKNAWETFWDNEEN
jgi:hypothetical protein